MKNYNQDESSSRPAKKTMMLQDMLEEEKNRTDKIKEEEDKIIESKTKDKSEEKKEQIVENNAKGKVEKKKEQIIESSVEDKSKTRESEINEVEEVEDKNNKIKDKPAFFQNKKKSKIPIIIALFLGLVIIIALAMLYLFNDKISEKEVSQDIVNSSIKAMGNVESLAFDGNFDFSFINDENEIFLATKFDGKSDKNNSDDIKSSFNIKPEIKISKEGGSQNLSFDLSAMSFDKTGEEMAYFKLNDINLGAAGLMLGKTITPYKDKWYFWDVKKTMEKDDLYSEMQEEDSDFNTKMRKIKEIFKRYELIKFQKDLGDTEIDSKKVHHYQVKPDSETLSAFYMEILKEVFEFDFDETDKDEFKEKKEEIATSLDEFLKNIEVEIWIGKEDRLIYKIYLSGNYDEKDMERISEMTLGKARAKAVDAAIKSEVSSKQPELIIYCDDNNGDCRGFKSKYWGSTVSPKYQIEQHIETGEDYSYVIWSELCSTTDKWCVDSEENQGYVLGEIEGTQCPDRMSSVPQGKKRNCATGVSENDSLEKLEMSFNLTMAMSDFNQPIEFVKPEEAKDLLEVLEKMEEDTTAGFMGGLMSGLGDIHFNDSDSDGLIDSMEEFYKTDKNNPDTDGDGYLDGGEVNRGYDPTIPGDARL